MFELESGIVSFCFCFIFVSSEEPRLFLSLCADGRCGKVCSDEDRGMSRRPGAEGQRWSHWSGTRWVVDFLVEPQNQCGGRFSGLGL
jgi:hypothetical protein